MRKKFISRDPAESKEYKDVLKAIKKTGKCPFCKENFKYHKKPILFRKKNWFITKSSWPYKNTQYHFLIISKKHKEDFTQLNTSDFSEVSQLAKWATGKYKIKGGALTLRFGKAIYTGSTVNHLHFHLIVPEINKNTKKTKTVHFAVG
ncbi:MAG TPA: HIT domain-containing protein [bacterium]|nr:HIT domain-containing protein [bacterium]